MAGKDFTDVQAYLADQPEPARAILLKVRAAILEASPDSEECISYKIPTYRLPPNGAVFYFAGWKKHWSLYPATPAIIEAFQEQLAAYQVEKGTIRFPYGDPPIDLIQALVRFRSGEPR